MYILHGVISLPDATSLIFDKNISLMEVESIDGIKRYM